MVKHRTEPYLVPGYHERLHSEGTISDNLNNRGWQGRLRINVHEEHEVRYWTEQLAVTRDELVNAATAVGIMAADVRKTLGK